ncbi:anti-sigma factor, partial [Paracoccus sp. PXZ]
PPPSVSAALSARDASVIRMAMVSQPEVAELDAAEMRAATGILLPRFAPDWTIRDAQVFPSPQGPGIEILFDTPDLGRVSHFSVRTGSFGVTLPRAETGAGHSVAWFQIGETAHVLIADGTLPEELLAAARTLSATLY